ncbi:MAG: FtsK/SpoIIIE domain-containing protein [Acinetobacter sp.]
MKRILETASGRIQNIELNTPVEQQDLAKTQLYKELLQPVKEFTIREPILLDGTCYGDKVQVPVWFNTTLKSINIRPGFAKLDTALPACLPLSDAPVHALIGGKSGSGKSVLLNDIITTLLFEYPPWELEMMLADFKVVELSRYANRIPTPHVSIVAATSSTEFALSLFKSMTAEMNARQDVFTMVGVQNIKDFRKKFDLVLPRVLLIADEFVQMYQNIKIAMEAGNDKADEQKQQINASISGVARLGRSQGMHMVLSSQDMGGVLDEQTSGQFAAGIALSGEASVSNTLIGNTAGTTLEGKGKAYLNLNKTGKSVEDNELVWVPFINDNISEEDAAAGKMSYLQNSLLQTYQLAQKYGWSRKPVYYNENETIPRQLYAEHLKYAVHQFNNPAEGTDIQNSIYKLDTFAAIPLGKEIALTEAPTCLLTLKRRRMSNLVIAADTMLTRIYIMKLVAEGLNAYNATQIILAADNSMYLQTQFETLLKSPVVIPQAEVPVRYINMVSARLELLSTQAFLTSHGVKSSWNEELVFKRHVESCAGSKRNLIANVLRVGEMLEFRFSQVERIEHELPKFSVQLSPDEKKVFSAAVSRTNSTYQTVEKMTNGSFEVITASSFEQLVVWWVGLEEVQGILDYEMKQKLLGFFEASPSVGIFNVLVAVHWQRVGSFATKCNFILEKASKDFFNDIELPKNININKNSFQLHNRELRTRNIIRMFND